MKTLKTVVVDDEYMARESVVKLLKAYCKNVVIAGEASDLDEAERLIINEKPDLVLLDIRMPGGTGFDLLQRFTQIDFKIIFITAYDEYAIKAFKYSAIDYLLKPIEPNQLIHAINKINDALENEHLLSKIKDFIAHYPEQLMRTQKIRISSPSATYIIDLSRLIRAETACKGSVRLVLKDKEDVLVNKTLKEFENIVKKHNQIYRIHKSHLINLDHIIAIEKATTTSMKVTMADNTTISVSSRRKAALMDSLMKQVET